MKALKNIVYNTLSSAWATLYRIDFDFQFKDGSWKRLSRESYDRGNGTSILLYNSNDKTVILTKQFRMPAYINNPEEGYSIEVCAGALYKNEDPKACIIREVEEEAGYRISNATKVMESYMSPGALTEKMYFFIATYNEDMKINEGGGLAIEHEEIEVLKISIYEALKMIDTGEIKDAKTIMLLQYAQIHNLI